MQWGSQQRHQTGRDVLQLANTSTSQRNITAHRETCVYFSGHIHHAEENYRECVLCVFASPLSCDGKGKSSSPCICLMWDDSMWHNSASNPGLSAPIGSPDILQPLRKGFLSSSGLLGMQLPVPIPTCCCVIQVLIPPPEEMRAGMSCF